MLNKRQPRFSGYMPPPLSVSRSIVTDRQTNSPFFSPLLPAFQTGVFVGGFCRWMTRLHTNSLEAAI